jgi:hypothetical protein
MSRLYSHIDSNLHIETGNSKTETFTFLNHRNASASVELSSIVNSAQGNAFSFFSSSNVWLTQLDIITAPVNASDWEATTYNYNTDPTKSSCGLHYSEISTTLTPTVVDEKMQLELSAQYEGQPLLQVTLVESSDHVGELAGTASIQLPALAGTFPAVLNNSQVSSANLVIELDNCQLELAHFRALPSTWTDRLASTQNIDFADILDFESQNISTLDQLQQNQLQFAANETGMQLDVTEQVNFTNNSSMYEKKTLLNFEVEPVTTADAFTIAFDLIIEDLDSAICEDFQVNVNASGGNSSYDSPVITGTARIESSLMESITNTRFDLIADTSCESLGDNFKLYIDNLIVSYFEAQ